MVTLTSPSGHTFRATSPLTPAASRCRHLAAQSCRSIGPIVWGKQQDVVARGRPTAAEATAERAWRLDNHGQTVSPTVRRSTLMSHAAIRTWANAPEPSGRILLTPSREQTHSADGRLHDASTASSRNGSLDRSFRHPQRNRDRQNPRVHVAGGFVLSDSASRPIRPPDRRAARATIYASVRTWRYLRRVPCSAEAYAPAVTGAAACFV